MCELLKIYNECPVTEDFILENLSFSTSLLLVFILYTCKGKIGLHLSGLKWAELPDLGRLVSSLQRWKAIQKLGWWPVPARLCWISAFPPSHPPATLWRDSALCVTILAHPVPQQVTLYLLMSSLFPLITADCLIVLHPGPASWDHPLPFMTACHHQWSSPQLPSAPHFLDLVHSWLRSVSLKFLPWPPLLVHPVTPSTSGLFSLRLSLSSFLPLFPLIHVGSVVQVLSHSWPVCPFAYTCTAEQCWRESYHEVDCTCLRKWRGWLPSKYCTALAPFDSG